MGNFLMISGVIGSDPSDVIVCLGTLAKNKKSNFSLGGKYPDPNVGIISGGSSNTTILYPDDFMEWDEYSRFLSEKLAKPVFSLHVHDGDLWMYILYNKGREVDCFNPIPDYWSEIDDSERLKWKGNARIVSSLVPGVSAESIEEYFVNWDIEDESGKKAYPTDEYGYEDWQICDFMKKVGLVYPVEEDSEFFGQTFTLKD